jgi:peptidoglycan/LPS O-acetylase OafA/YrhL
VVEEKFYLVMPVVLFGAWRISRNRWRVLLLAGIALLPFVIRLAMYPGYAAPHAEDFLRNWRNPFHLNLDSLFLGAIAAWVALRHSREPNRILAALPNHLVTAGATLVAGLMVAPLLVPDLAFFRHVLLFPLTALGMGLILFGSALKPRGTSPLLEGKLLARAGRLAYPWYLTHVLVLHWVWGEMTTRFPTLRELAPAEQLGLFLPVFLVVSIGAALVLHFAVEKPCLILKDSLGRRPAVEERESPALTPHTA